jgi:thiamine transport system substrate-binding protein
MKQLFLTLTVVLFLISACSPAVVKPVSPPEPGKSLQTENPPAVGENKDQTAVENPSNGKPTELVVMTHDSFSASEGVISAFETSNNVKVSFIKGGDTGAALNRAILSKASPLADVFFGVDNTFLSRAVESDIFEEYTSPMLMQIPDEFKIAPDNRLSPVDYGDVCINYDKTFFKDLGLQIPQSLEALTKSEYKGMLVVENPATSSPGLAFLLATIKAFGVENYLDYWRSLRENDVLVVNDWETAYYTHFSGSSGRGPRPMVVSYGTSPAAEMIFADPRPEEAPTASLVGENMCFRQVEFAGILKGTKNRALAEKFIDYLLDEKFQSEIPMQMFVFPVNRNVEVPEDFRDFVQVPEIPAVLNSDDIAENRETWVDAWEEVMLR